ncbi:MAG: hypothetical protein HC886_14445 [Leptolyngbyaceae cyanobacterium SM1_1_3]|nr:hypothetical protein [Leptolyngbyaceae cyanobacterium SM1_1_3]NJN03994.1 hypothetical protein [Leptolyngbyaceae cyanobacterium RM1_1_2]NJO11009.1 hypothetical protein [Leptolyngbyaceae cyanobacterium SL_1_1]
MSADESFSKANYLLRKKSYAQWHRLQSKLQILRSQVGFSESVCSRPRACVGCLNYHGVDYGSSKARRHLLVCAMHPYGWQLSTLCPDRQIKQLQS